MKTIVIYDSVFGNTKQIAESIASHLGENTKIQSIDQLSVEDWQDSELLIIGSPINGWRPTEKIKKWLSSLSNQSLMGKKVASFDTRVKLFIHGDAANQISKELQKAGAKTIVDPQAFFVAGSKGPLLPGEIDKAKLWAQSIKEKCILC